MKKVLLIGLVSGVAATGAFAQGSVANVTGIFNVTGIALQGPADASSPSASDVTYLTGNVTLALYYAASITAAQLTAINAYDIAGTAGSGTAALAALAADGFTEVSVPGGPGTTVSAGTYSVAGGGISGPTSLDTVGLYGGGVTSGGSGYLAEVVTEVGGADAGYDGVLAWYQSNLGGNPNATPAGLPVAVSDDPAGNYNLVLTNPTSIPEPGTIALAVLGGASLLMFRRKK